MYRLLHLADVHLDAPLGGFGREAETRRAEVLDSFRALSEVAVDEEVDAVLISGDLFDRPRPSESAVITVRETVRRLVREEIRVFAIAGNHDARALNPGLYAESLPGAGVFDSPRFGPPVRIEGPEADLFVYGISHDAAEEPDPLSTFRRDQRDGLHVIMLHGSIPGAPHWDAGSALALPLDALAILEADYIALGDLHRHRPPDELEGLPAAYPGSFAAVDFTESGLHGPLIVEIERGSPPRVRRRSSGVREVAPPCSVDVSGCRSDAEVADAVSREAPAESYPVVTLTGEPSYPLDADTVRTILEERFGALFLRDESRFFDLGRLQELARQNTIAGHVARMGLADIEEVEEEREVREQALRIALRALEVS